MSEVEAEKSLEIQQLNASRAEASRAQTEELTRKEREHEERLARAQAEKEELVSELASMRPRQAPVQARWIRKRS